MRWPCYLRLWRVIILAMKMISRDDIADMTAAERLDLIGELWDSLTDEQVQLTPGQIAEIDRRLDSFDEDKKHAITWQEFEAKLAARKL